MCTGALKVSNAFFGQGTGAILFYNINCPVSATHIDDCSRQSLPFPTFCNHNQDVGILCQDSCSQGELRLTQGNNISGSVEICINGIWTGICDNQWNFIDASVACKQLGLPHSGAEIQTGLSLGSQINGIRITNVSCNGNEPQLINCDYVVSTNIDCLTEGAGIICLDSCSNDMIRLAGGESDSEGRVEVCMSQQWGTVCDNQWSTTDGQVICHQLGYSTASELHSTMEQQLLGYKYYNYSTFIVVPLTHALIS